MFVWRDERCVAFMSINPTAPGHALVVPIAEVDHWIDLDIGLAGHLTAVAHTIGRAQFRAFAPMRIGLLVAGFEVPHVHLHVIPMADMSQLDLATSARTPDVEAISAAARRIRDELRAMGEVQVSD